MKRCSPCAGWKKGCNRYCAMGNVVYLYGWTRKGGLLLITLWFSLAAAVVSVNAQNNIADDDLLRGFDDLPNAAAGQGEEVLSDGFDDDGSRPCEDESLLDGFEDDSDLAEDNVPKSAESKSSDASFQLTGHIKAAASYNYDHSRPQAGETDWRGYSSLATELSLTLEVAPIDDWQVLINGQGRYDALYGLKGREDYTHEVLDAYEDEAEFGEAYVQGRLSEHLDIKLGRQIVVWGKADYLRVTDVINPLDLRVPGLTDIADLRLPVTLTRIDAYWCSFNLTGMAIHEVRFNKNPPFGSDFYPSSSPAPPEAIPASRPENTQFAFSLNGLFSGWDLALYWADVYSADTYLEQTALNSDHMAFTQHARIKMTGAAVSIASGNWLLKSEAAWIDGLKFTNSPGRTYKRLDILFGLEYAGLAETQLSLEVADQHLFEHHDDLRHEPDTRDEDQLQWTVGFSRDFLNDTFNLALVICAYGLKGEGGAWQRFSGTYDLTDAAEISVGVLLYQSGDLFVFNDVAKNDRLFVSYKYRF